MNRKLLVVALFGMFSATAFANGGEGNNTGCSGQGNPNSPCIGNNEGTVNTTTTNSNNTLNNTNDNSSFAGSSSGAYSYGTGIANSNSTGGAGGSANVGNVTATANNTNTGNSSNSNRNSVRDSGNSSNTTVTNVTQEAQPRDPVSSAIAPSVIAGGSDQCLVPVSGGAQAVGFGVSIGSAVPDKICEALKLSRELARYGLVIPAIRLLMNADPRVNEVLKEFIPNPQQ